VPVRPFRAFLRGCRALSFVAQFAVVSALLLMLAGLALAQVLGHLIEERARQDAVNTAQAITDIGIAPNLEPNDFLSPLDADGQAAMRAALGAVLGGHGSGVYDKVLRVNVFGNDGTVLYSDEPALVGRRFAGQTNLERALDGEVVSAIEELSSGSGEGPADTKEALEVYVPLTYGLHTPVGVAESYLPYAPVARAIQHDKLLLYGALGLTLLLFWLVMARMVSQASRRMQATASRNDYLARHDVLTALPNRAYLLEQLEAALHGDGRGEASVAVLLIDLDRFKEINDTLGHETGDELLQQVGSRIGEQLERSGLAGSSSVARLGGDEFAVLLTDVGDTAPSVAARLLDSLHHPFEIDGIELAVEASIGLAWAPDHADEAGALLRHADVAMYEAKEHRGAYAVYDSRSDISSLGRITLLNELRQALDEDQLVLHYQPKEELSDGSVRSVEALVRWHHPERGIIPPSEFLPLVEQTGLITALTRRVLDEAVRQLRVWGDEGRDLSVSINLSARNLVDHALPDLVAERLATHGVDPRRLEVEVTETNAMTDPARASESLRRLAALGVSVSVDDYGTGYSSLSYLRSLPVDTLKIDRSFVTPMLVDEGNAVIVRSTIELAHNLGLRVVAEGVEDEATREALAMLGCHFAQGYYLSKPLPADALVDLLDRRRPSPARVG
jgi:diguanylate cyclase (GGDEF)-like protein